MKFFILEDEIDKLPRCAILDSLKDHTLTVAQSLTEAKEKYKGPYDILLLDHDMNGEFCDDRHPNTGHQFVKWLVTQLVADGATKDKDLPQVVLHSQNPTGRRNMRSLLEDFGFHVVEYPYCRAYAEWLKTL